MNDGHLENMDLNEGKSLKEYYLLIRKNILLFIITWIVVTIAVMIYAYTKPDIYKATSIVKISEPTGSVLNNSFLTGLQATGEDRFIANELEILKSYRLRAMISKSIIDSFYLSDKKDKFSCILNKSETSWNSEISKKFIPYGKDTLPFIISDFYEATQKRGLDIVEITAKSQSPYEAALLSRIIAKSYFKLNLELNKQYLSMDREFLGEQRRAKLETLAGAEEELEAYQKKTGIVALPEQASSLIDLISDFESKKNAVQIDLTMSEKSLKKYKEELANQDPMIKDYLESFATEPYIKSLQEQIAKLESQKDLAMTNSKARDGDSQIVEEFDQKITELKGKLNEKINIYKAGIFASSPEEIKTLTQKILEEEVKFQAMKSSFSEWTNLVQKYEARFDKIPMRSMELARLEREKRANEKLYLLLEEKYQEAQIQEQSIPGNVIIIDEALVPFKPAEPNRKMIAFIGLIMGFGLAFGLIFIIDFFDSKVRTPDQLQHKKLNYITYIPQIGSVNGNGTQEVVYSEDGQTIAGEAFRTLRTRIRFAKMLQKDLKLILITSANEQEGKTFISSNLASSFALSNQKTLLIDLDLRKPRVHKFFGSKISPGITDFFLKDKKMSEIIRNTGRRNLQYITSGTIPPNPAELIASPRMADTLQKLKQHFDVVIVDSAPLLAVSDSEVLTRYVDGTYLVVNSGTTESDSVQHAADILQYENSSFKGVILNRFTPQKGDGYYYRYSYNYNYYKDSQEEK